VKSYAIFSLAFWVWVDCCFFWGRFIWTENWASAKNYFCGTGGARCRINKDTEEKKQGPAVEDYCLKTPDTVVHGKNHEPIDSRRIP
jgi:hypothetical protein